MPADSPEMWQNSNIWEQEQIQILLLKKLSTYSTAQSLIPSHSRTSVFVNINLINILQTIILQIAVRHAFQIIQIITLVLVWFKNAYVPYYSQY
jgi:hypothetical protein